MNFGRVASAIFDLNEMCAELRGEKSVLKKTVMELLSIIKEPTIAGGFAYAHYVR